ncbi:hypothetical protein B484DRAFT_409444 [Ochromonadaceae sp. CCMP2298]|nr:hypothetical protein B484DRAFT_409444 [Ochromonadaceae sp. CCMP2298]
MVVRNACTVLVAENKYFLATNTTSMQRPVSKGSARSAGGKKKAKRDQLNREIDKLCAERAALEDEEDEEDKEDEEDEELRGSEEKNDNQEELPRLHELDVAMIGDSSQGVHP